MSTRSGRPFKGILTDFQRDEILFKILEQVDSFNYRLNSLESRSSQRRVMNNLLTNSKKDLIGESKRVGGVPKSKKVFTQNSTCSKEGRDQTQIKVKGGQITKNEKPLIAYSKETQQSPVIPDEEPLNLSCVTTKGESRKLVVAGSAIEMCLKLSNFPSKSSESTTSTTIVEHQSLMSLRNEDAGDKISQVIGQEFQIISDEMPPIEDSRNFLEDTRVGSEGSSVPSSNKTNEVKQTVSSLISSKHSTVTGWLPKLAYALPKEMACDPSYCIGDQHATYLILSSKLPNNMCSRKHGNSKVLPTSTFIREDFKNFYSISNDFIIPEKFNFGNGMTLLLTFLPPKKKRRLPYADFDMKIRLQLIRLWTTILQHFKTRGRVFSNHGRMMRYGKEDQGYSSNLTIIRRVLIAHWVYSGIV